MLLAIHNLQGGTELKTLIVYDSKFGNAEKIARAIGKSITPLGEVKVIRANETNISELSSVNFLIVGSPTRGGRPTSVVKDFVKKIPANALKNVGVTSFDTRLSYKDSNIGLRLLMRIGGGHANGRIANSLKDKGGHLAAEPEGFIVEHGNGPLRKGEIERADGWAKEIVGGKR